MSQAKMTVNGVSVSAEDPDGYERLLIARFRQLYAVMGQLDRKNSCGLNFHDFQMGYTWMAFDLTKSGRAANSITRQPVREGHTRLDIKFSTSLPLALNVFSMAQFHAFSSISHNRTVTYNFVS